MTWTEKQQSFLDDFLVIDDVQERLGAVVDRARRLPPLPAAERTDARRVPGCVSAVWLVPELRDGRCLFRADADSPLVRGLVHLLCDAFSGGTPAEIAASAAEPLDVLGLAHNLSPTRRHGLAAVRAAIRAFAQSQVASASPDRPAPTSDLRA